MQIGWSKIRTVIAAIALALALQLYAHVSMAGDLLARAGKLAAPARAFPELARLSEQVSDLILRMDASTKQLQQYLKARVRSRDRRYSALTREFNQERNQVSELERKLAKAPSLDVSRFQPLADAGRGGARPGAYQKAVADDKGKYEQAKAQLGQALNVLSAHYDQQLRIISNVRN